MIQLTQKSLNNLKGVHPKLQAIVLLTALRIDYPFNVAEGLRTAERQIEMVNQGKSKTLKSKHLIQKDGFAHAVDLYPLTDDRKRIDWAALSVLAKDIKESAKMLGYDITWGGDWTSFKDQPHYELK